MENIDGAALAADFYLLEWLTAQGDRRAGARLAQWTPQLSADLAGQLDLIIGTELGHYKCARLDTHPAELAAFLRQVTLGDSRVGWRRTRQELGEIRALELAVDAFAGPGVEYGGEAWAPIAAILRRYAAGELPARVFIDQCFTLQHNNGCLFDKYFEAEHLMPVLEAQAAGNLTTLARHASPEVRRRWQRYRHRLERDYSPEWLGDDRAADVALPDPPRTARLAIGAPPPGGLGCGSAEEADQLTASSRDAAETIRTRTWQFRRPWPAVPRGYSAVTATLHTDLGAVQITLWPAVVPHTVDNFVALACGARPWRDPTTGERRDDPFYDGVEFHRRVPGFVVEAGDRSGTGRGGPGYRIPDEFRADAVFDRPFLVAMANNGRDSAGSRFFITLDEARHLDGKFVQFGEVTQAACREVVTTIAEAQGRVWLRRVTVDADGA